MENRINKQELDRKMVLLGFTENLQGTEMLRVAIQEWEPGMLITKELLPIVARKCGSTPARVEHAMRIAIDRAWDRGSYDTRQLIFGYSIKEGCSPTVGEFVGRMAYVLENGYC